MFIISTINNDKVAHGNIMAGKVRHDNDCRDEWEGPYEKEKEKRKTTTTGGG